MRKDLESGLPSARKDPRKTSKAGVSASRAPRVLFPGIVKVSCTPSPACWAARSMIASGTGGMGGVGSPGAPQPAAARKMENRKWKVESGRTGPLSRSAGVPFLFCISNFKIRRSEDVTAQILVLYDVGELLVDVRRIHLHAFLLEVRCLEGKLIEHFFENRMQPAGADILSLLVHVGGKARDGLNGVFRDLQLHALGLEQRNILLDQRIFRLGEDAHEIFFLERLHFHTNRQAALQLGDQVGGLGDMEGAGGNKQNVVRTNHSVARVDGGAFDNRQNVALHAFARNIRAVPGFPPGYLVDF